MHQEIYVESSFYKTILSHAPKYITGSALASLATLVMTKYYTAVFSPSKYGVLALYLMMFQFVKSFASLSLDSGSTRLYFDYKDTRKNEYLSTVFWLIAITSATTIILGLVFMPFIVEWIAPNTHEVYIVTLITGIAAVFVSYLTRILYNENKSTDVLKHSLLQTILNHLTSFIFISLFNLGITGRMSGQGFGYIANIFSLSKSFAKNKLFQLKWLFDKAMAKETIQLNLPAMISTIQGILFIYVDRIFIKHYIGNSAVGIYTLGFMLGKGLSIVYEAVSQSMLPKTYSDMTKNYEKSRKELESFAIIYFIGLMLITAVISFSSPLIVSLLSTKEYQAASIVMPFVMSGFMMGGFYKIPSLMLGFHKKVWFYPFLSLFTFIANATLNWLLIPKFGILGAAFTNFLGVYLYATILQALSWKYHSSQYNFKVTLIYILTLLAVCFNFINTSTTKL